MGRLTPCAFVFAGQGAQAAGMGSSLFESNEAAHEVFMRAEEARPGTQRQCFEGTAEELRETRNTQPCLWTVEMAAAAALSRAGITPQAVAGFSLGEMAALTYGGACTFEDGLALVMKRAAHMSDAAQASAHETAMAAVMKLEADVAEEMCAPYPHLWPVNYNCPGQTVVSGYADELRAFADDVKQARGLARVLNVSGAFHSPLMQDAAHNFARDLADVALSEPDIPVYANVTAEVYPAERIAALLEMQMASPVKWQATIERMHAEQGISTFIEIGPGKTLSGFIKRILPDAVTLHVEDAESLAATLEAWG